MESRTKIIELFFLITLVCGLFGLIQFAFSLAWGQETFNVARISLLILAAANLTSSTAMHFVLKGMKSNKNQLPVSETEGA